MRKLVSHCISVALLAVAFALPACSDDAGTLVVEVRTGLVPGPEFASVETDILESAAATSGAAALRQATAVASFGERYVAGKRVAEFSNVAPGEMTVRVRLMTPDSRRLIERRVRVSMPETETAFVLVVHMSRECVDVTCPNEGGDASLSECLGGRCVDPRCNPPAGTEFCPADLFCLNAAECDATAACANAECVDGLCESAARDDVCAANEWCDPDPNGGCVPFEPDAGTMDAGVADASLDDASMDGGAIDATLDATLPDSARPDAGPICGTICISESDPCRFDAWDCESGTAVCPGRMQRPAGAHCGEGSVCSEFGTCDPCVAGTECLVGGCVPGRTACTLGYEDCYPTGEPALPAGTECGTGYECLANGSCVPSPGTIPCNIGCDHGSYHYSTSGMECVLDGSDADPGTYCDSGSVCDADGECVACSAGRSCVVGCNLGSTSCYAGPSCDVSPSLYAAAGTSCGSGRVCDGAGTCDLCSAGAVCEPEFECQVRLTDCSRGAACVLAYNKVLGTACSLGQCNGLGACVTPLDALSVLNSDSHACAIRTDRSLTCWGGNFSGELGIGDGSFPFTTKYNVPGVSNVAEIAIADQRTCVRTLAGDLFCWGRNFTGEIGDGTTTPSSTPVHVTLPLPATSIAANQGNTCAVLNNGTVRCWGIGYAGVIGNGSTADVLTPTAVTGLSDATKVVLAQEMACALRSGQNVSCWGSGGVGNGSPSSTTPVLVSGLSQVVALSSSPDSRTACAIRNDGHLLCWGGDFGASPTDVALPFADAIQVQENGVFRCVLRASGQVQCAGMNYWSGQLGRGPVSMPEVHLPFAPVLYITNATAIAPHGCARVASGAWYCWGQNVYDQLGTGTSELSFDVPTVVRGP